MEQRPVLHWKIVEQRLILYLGDRGTTASFALGDRRTTASLAFEVVEQRRPALHLDVSRETIVRRGRGYFCYTEWW